MSTRTRLASRRAAQILGAALVIGLLAACATLPGAVPTRSALAPKPAGPDITYLALGDGTVYGDPLTCAECITYPYLVATALQKKNHKTVRLFDGSQGNGLTMQMLADEIRTNAWLAPTAGNSTPAPHKAIAAADIITITANDNSLPFLALTDPCNGIYDAACINKVEKPFISALRDVLLQIHTLREGKPTAIRITTAYNLAIPSSVYQPQVSRHAIAVSRTTVKTFLDRWNSDICSTAPQIGALCVDIYHGINGPNGTKPLPYGWYTPKYPSLRQPGHDFIAAEMPFVSWQPLKLK